jgi:hypothetical protein
VLAKQTIVHLQDTDMLDVIIALPESVVRSVSSAAPPTRRSVPPAPESSAAAVRAMVSFEDYPDISYALDLKEIATRADPDTQTFRVTFRHAPATGFHRAAGYDRAGRTGFCRAC